MPLLFAAFNVPLDRFMLPLCHTVFGSRASVVTFNGTTTLKNQLLPWYHQTTRAVVLDGLALGDMALMIWAWISVGRRAAGSYTHGARLSPMFVATQRLAREISAVGWSELATLTGGPVVQPTWPKRWARSASAPEREPSRLPHLPSG
jgi:hypothetical protein